MNTPNRFMQKLLLLTTIMVPLFGMNEQTHVKKNTKKSVSFEVNESAPLLNNSTINNNQTDTSLSKTEICCKACDCCLLTCAAPFCPVIPAMDITCLTCACCLRMCKKKNSPGRNDAFCFLTRYLITSRKECNQCCGIDITLSAPYELGDCCYAYCGAGCESDKVLKKRAHIAALNASQQ